MPSPFPGMDPYIESQRWEPFHTAYIVSMVELLVPRVRPDYVVDIEKYVFLVREEGDDRLYRTDVHLRESGTECGTRPSVPVATLEPTLVEIPLLDEQEQKFLTIRTRDGHEVVTVIELLSPSNKDPGRGLSDYLRKRDEYIQAACNVVEIDLLRGGAELPTNPAPPGGDYRAYVVRHGNRRRVETYSWSLRDRLPVIPVPLGPGEPDVPLDLQAAFDLTYDRGGYDYSLNYHAQVVPPMTAEYQSWSLNLLSKV